MKSFKLVLLLLSLNTFDVYKTTHAVQEKNDETEIKNKEVIELNKNITVNTDLNFDKKLGQFNITESYKKLSRKVTIVDNDSLERKPTIGNKSVTTTTVLPFKVTKIISEAGGVLEIQNTSKNSMEEIKSKNATIKFDENSKNDTNEIGNLDKSSNKTTIKPASANKTTSTTIKPTISTNNTLVSGVNSTFNAGNKNSSISISPTAKTTTPSSASTTTTTKATTTTSTTHKPKKPIITYSVPDFPDLEKDNTELKNLLQAPVSNKLPSADGPYAQPSKEYNGSLPLGRDFILPIVSMIFIIPLVIGILITSYRRFRDCWTTRHYRRMDFLVDGMYND